VDRFGAKRQNGIAQVKSAQRAIFVPQPKIKKVAGGLSRKKIAE